MSDIVWSFRYYIVENKNAIKTLIYLMDDKVSWVRDWATFGIGQIERNNKTIREALWRRVNDKHEEAKFEAIVGLAKRKDIRVKEIIKRELLDGEYGTLLFEAIEELNDKSFLPILYQTLEKAEKDKTVKSHWIDALKSYIERLNKR
jgi:HEAT repeat protein